MITEPVLTIEPKNVNAYQAPNRLHVMLSSNHDWVLSMGHDDRRYFVLEPSSDRLADTAYFAAIQKQLDEGGYEAMLYDLQHIDLSGFNVRIVPRTIAAVVQKRKTLEESHDPNKLLEAWWLSVTEDGLPDENDWSDVSGRLIGPKPGDKLTRPCWRSTRDLHVAACNHHERLRNLSPHRLGKFLQSKLVGGSQHRRPNGGLSGFDFGGLEDHRQRWEKARGFKGNWEKNHWDPPGEPQPTSDLTKQPQPQKPPNDGGDEEVPL
jgi:hypothetical protein